MKLNDTQKRVLAGVFGKADPEVTVAGPPSALGFFVNPGSREWTFACELHAIVGVFLRVLEYYRGILFMTSNRGTNIDDAIVSRATARIRYVTPDDEAKLRIWGVLSEQFGVKLLAKEVEGLIRDFPNATGRNIKNLLKLGKRYATARKEQTGPQHIRKVAKFIDMPELEEDETKAK